MKDLKMYIEIKRYADGTISESNFNSKYLSYDELFDEFHSCEGKILIYFLNEFSNILEDEIPHLIKNLCFESLEKILEGHSYVYNYFSQYGYVRLDPEGTNILVSGDDITTVRYPLRLFAEELFRCGEMFLKVLEGVSISNDVEPKMQKLDINAENLNSLRQLLDESKNRAANALAGQ